MGCSNSNTRPKIYGVEVEDSACLLEAIKADKRVRLREVGLFADGVAVERIGKHNFDVIRECVDGVITVSIDELCAAVKDIFEDTRVLSEPAGALALAGLKNMQQKFQTNAFLLSVVGQMSILKDLVILLKDQRLEKIEKNFLAFKSQKSLAAF